MSSGTLTESAPREPGGISAWQFFLLLAMLGATVAVILTKNTHPAALLLLSGAVIAAGLVAIGFHRALGALLGREGFVTPRPTGRDRELLESDKALILRSIKEAEFDRAMGKMSEADFQELSTRLRARAIAIMQQLDVTPGSAGSTGSSGPAPAARRASVCTTCGTVNDADARFCKQCGGKLG
jgi:hypothetical protein